MLFQACAGAVILGAFYANREYITQYLCENRDKPQLHCEGNCVLMKKIKKVRENEKKNMENKLKEVNFFVVESIVNPILPDFSMQRKCVSNFDMRASLYSFSDHNRILRPPIAA